MYVHQFQNKKRKILTEYNDLFIKVTTNDDKIESKNQNEMPTTPGIPRRSPIQVLTGLDVA